jgi:hypothetical protein
MKIKYPKILHLPYSLAISNDDKVLKDDSIFKNEKVIVFEKMDGENTTMYSDHIHARSIDSKYHESRNLVKRIHSEIKHLIPKDYRVCGENMYAKHSIHYHHLKTYFYIFSIWFQYQNDYICYDIEELYWITDYFNSNIENKNLKVSIPNVIYRDIFDRDKILEVFENYKKESKDEVEGFVILKDKRFFHSDFQNNIAKFVRKDHVQTNYHWLSQKIIKNEVG